MTTTATNTTGPQLIPDWQHLTVAEIEARINLLNRAYWQAYLMPSEVEQKPREEHRIQTPPFSGGQSG